MSRECERSWEVDALREGRLAARDIDSFARHRERCEECRARLAADERLAALGRALAAPAIDPLHVRRLRQSILRRAATSDESSRSRASRGMLAAVLVALAVTGVLAAAPFVWRLPLHSRVESSNAPPAVTRPFGATIHAEPGAVWETRTDGLVEHVKLGAGAITLIVRHREAGERFIVDLPDGEIEVRGTQFRVDVLGQTTRSVQVFEGLVALRRIAAAEVLLAEGDTWPAESSRNLPRTGPGTTPSPSARTSQSTFPPHASPAIAPPWRGASRARATSEASSDDAQYEAAVDLFTAGQYEDAARALHAFATAHPESGLGEDAAFLEASALARAGRTDAAAVVAERFLDGYPASLHASDAATLVAREARDRHDCARAQSVAMRWIAEPVARAAALGACAASSK